ncbi:MAG TPA: hypothetical protein EYP62_07735 [Kiritimatiellae bacterium]|nr:hypothetical protein [Kiritimatiellia bacterium]
MKRKFIQALRRIREHDRRYAPEAYWFVCEGLNYTIRRLDRAEDPAQGHVSGRELLEGLRQYALENYGPVARRVLSSWGVNRTEDFGEIVFSLVEQGLVEADPGDSKADFAGGYDFDTAFAAPFRPEGSPIEPGGRSDT